MTSSASTSKPQSMKLRRAAFPLLATAVLIAAATQAGSQSLTASVDAPTIPSGIATSNPPGVDYVRPTSATKARNYAFEAFGPYPVVGSAFAAGINQLSNSPPEWNQGAEGFGRRFGSDFGIAAIGTTTRYGLAAVLREDTLYYRCECTGVLPRMSHAAISTFTGRRGAYGHRIFSIPALVAPYAGTMAGVYGWYPSRFGAMDAFRMGNYALLGSVARNISLEFLYNRSHSLLARMHLDNTHGAPDPGLEP